MTIEQAQVATLAGRVIDQVEQAVVGKRPLLQKIMAAILAGGHVLLEDYPGVAGVRVVTRIRGGPEVARALLARTELTGVLWRRALNIAGRARLEGTEHPSLLEELVRWGEDHTEYEYNPRYTSR